MSNILLRNYTIDGLEYLVVLRSGALKAWESVSDDDNEVDLVVD